MKLFSKVTAAVLAVCIVFTSSATASAQEVNNALADRDEFVNSMEDSRHEQINSLMDQKDLLSINAADNQEEIEQINQELSALGVEEITPQQVSAMFGAAKTIDGGRAPRVTVPSSSKNTWSSVRYTYTYSGTTYEVQQLIATPKNSSSPLTLMGSRTISDTFNATAGVVTGLKVIGSTAVGLTGTIPTLGIAIYDLITGVISGVGRETTITGANANYTWSLTTRATFSYVKQNGKSDNDQTMTYISTKVNGEIGVQFPSITVKGGSTVGSVSQSKRTITATPSGHESLYNAVYAYVNVSGQTRAMVDYLDIVGINGKRASYIYPVTPAFPAHCE